MSLQDALTPDGSSPSAGGYSLRKAIADRGHRIHNIWVGYSFKLKQTIILNSDVALCHAVTLEIDPRVKTWRPEAPSFVTVIDERQVGTRFDADVTFTDGTASWDESKSEMTREQAKKSDQIRAQRQVALEHGREYRLFTREDFQGSMGRIWNGLRMLKTLAAARELPLARSRTAVLAAVRGGAVPHGDFRTLVDGDQGVNLAAAYALVLEGLLQVDLGKGPLHDHSLFTAVEGSS